MTDFNGCSSMAKKFKPERREGRPLPYRRNLFFPSADEIAVFGAPIFLLYYLFSILYSLKQKDPAGSFFVSLNQEHTKHKECAEDREIDDGEQLDVAACLARVVGVVCSECDKTCKG